MGEQMEAKRSGTDCPLGGEGERQGERSLHIQAAHFLTNYCCKTSFSPFSLPGPLSSLTLRCGIATRSGQRPALQATQVTEMTLEKAKGAVTETVTTCQEAEEKGSKSDLELM